MPLLKMKTTSVRGLLALGLATASMNAMASDQPGSASQARCPHAFPDSFESRVWQFLRREQRLAVNGKQDLESECGIVCAVNIVQAAAVYAGKPPVLNPDEAVDLIYRKFGTKLYQSQTVLAIKLLLDTYYPGTEAVVRSRLIIGPNDPHEQNTIRLSSLSASDLMPTATRLIMGYAVHFRGDNTMDVQHAHVFGYGENGNVALITPTHPYANVSAEAYETAQLAGSRVPLYRLLNMDTSANRFAPFGFISVDVGPSKSR